MVEAYGLIGCKLWSLFEGSLGQLKSKSNCEFNKTFN